MFLACQGQYSSVSYRRWCSFVFLVMLLALGGCCVGLGSNSALKRTSSSRRLPWFVSLGPRRCFFQARKNRVWLSPVFKSKFCFWLAGVSILRFRIGTGLGSLFRLCCWLWVAGVWAWVLTRRSSGRLPAAAYLGSLASAHGGVYSMHVKNSVLFAPVFQK